ncbi:MAG: class I SAM-dependent methyltransferase [Eubacterium sp.]
MDKKWNAENYTNNFQFVHKYGEDLIDYLTVSKGSLVVDLGCGNGALTQRLWEKGFRVLGIDASASMLQKAKELHGTLNFAQGDACSFFLEEKADAVFSNAVFHWIDNHERLVENISDNIKTGGELVFEFGGKGCAETIHNAMEKAFAAHGLKYKNRFNFRSIGEFTPILEKHGFRVEYAALFDRPTEQAGEDGLENWINMFLSSAFDCVNKETKDAIIKQVVEFCRPKLYANGKWFVDYVRLRMKAVKL